MSCPRPNRKKHRKEFIVELSSCLGRLAYSHTPGALPGSFLSGERERSGPTKRKNCGVLWRMYHLIISPFFRSARKPHHWSKCREAAKKTRLLTEDGVNVHAVYSRQHSAHGMDLRHIRGMGTGPRRSDSSDMRADTMQQLSFSVLLLVLLYVVQGRNLSRRTETRISIHCIYTPRPSPNSHLFIQLRPSRARIPRLF